VPEARVSLPGEVGSREWRKAAKRGAFKRQEQRGALVGVRVLDTDRMRQASQHLTRRDREGPARQSPVTHNRRGHWRRVRVGPRDDWHFEGRWIPPTVVNQGKSPSRVITVYRLPVPEPGRTEGVHREEDASRDLQLPEGMRQNLADIQAPQSRSLVDDDPLGGRALDL
jgi:hypothetical protein